MKFPDGPLRLCLSFLLLLSFLLSTIMPVLSSSVLSSLHVLSSSIFLLLNDYACPFFFILLHYACPFFFFMPVLSSQTTHAARAIAPTTAETWAPKG